MEALTDKRRAAAKRKVSSLDSGAASLLAEVAEKLDKMGKSKRLPKGLRNALQALLTKQSQQVHEVANYMHPSIIPACTEQAIFAIKHTMAFCSIQQGYIILGELVKRGL
eukprot:scaffold299655_cov19-Tisochrysis_lutea.AAC.1